MLKAALIVIILINAILFPGKIFAQDNNNIIDNLKEKVASRVAQLHLVEKRGIVGIVTSAQSTQITIEDINGTTRLVDIDEFTKFTSQDTDSFGISDVEKGMQLGILGLYNKDSRRTLARFVNTVEIPEFITGVVSSKDEENFTVTVVTNTNVKFIVDIERTTRTMLVDEENNITRAGFTDIPDNVNVAVVGFLNAEDSNRITGDRIYYFEGLPPDPSLATEALPDNAPVIPSTGSGVKLTPLTRP